MRIDVVADIAALLGLALLAVGLALYDLRWALIITGTILLAIGITAARRHSGHSN